MKSFKNLTIQARLWTAFVGVLVGVAIIATIAMTTIDAVKIKGDAYNRIYQANILLADVLPPPEYIVESYLVVSQLSYTSDPAQVRELDAQLTGLQKAYEERHAYWVANPVSPDFDGPLLRDSYAAATKFYTSSTPSSGPRSRRATSPRSAGSRAATSPSPTPSTGPPSTRS